MAKEKKISTRYTVNILKKDLEEPFQIKCRMIFNKKSTTLLVPLINGKYRCDEKTFNEHYKDKDLRLNPFDKWIKDVVRYDYQSNGSRDDYSFKFLSDKLGIYLTTINTFFSHRIIRKLLDGSLQVLLSYRKYERLKEIASYRKFTGVHIPNLFIEFLHEIKFENNIFIDELLSTEDIHKLEAYLTFILFEYDLIWSDVDSFTEILDFDNSSSINIGEWLSSKTIKDLYQDYLMNLLESKNNINLPSQIEEKYHSTILYNLPSYRNEWLSDNYSLIITNAINEVLKELVKKTE